jgi:diguanylate cyclase (GGDEF)-like protein
VSSAEGRAVRPPLAPGRGLLRHCDALAPWALNLAAALASLLVLTQLAMGAPGEDQLRLPWWALIAAFALTERILVHVHFRRGTHALTLGEIPMVVGLVFQSPVAVALAWSLGALIVLVPTRIAPVRLAFNLAVIWLDCAVAAAVLHAVPGSGHAALWLGVALGVTLASAASALLLSAAMALAGEPTTALRIRSMVVMGVLVSAINSSLGLAVAAVLAADPWAALLLVAPAAVLCGAYRAYVGQRQQRQELEFLYEASRTLTRCEDSATGLAGVLAMSLGTFRAEIAEVCMMPGGDGAEGRRVTVGPDERVEVLAPVAPDMVGELRELADGDDGIRVIVPEELGGALGPRLRGDGIREAMVARLEGDGRLVGTIMVANAGGSAAFGSADRRLFQTLAAHTGTMLGHDRLERRVLELHELRDELQHQAFHDPLTALANRLLFDDRVANALARRTGNAVVIYIDLDDFKPVNDTYGHEAGDALLCEVADRLRASLRAADTPARLGGDEFAVLLVDISPADVRVVADRILHNLTQSVRIAGRELRVGASMGVAIGASGTLSGEELLRNADAAMYVAKRGGKRGYVVHGQDGAPGSA